MAIFLDVPYDDEPLFGVVARYGHRSRACSWMALVRNLFGYAAPLHTGLAYNLDVVAWETEHVWGMSGSDIANAMTLLPYYASLSSEDFAGRLSQRVRQRRSGPVPGDVSKFIRRAPAIRLCGACIASDRRIGFAMRWRRVHQLPGVFVCPEHGEPLLTVPLGTSIGRPWPVPEQLPLKQLTAFPSCFDGSHPAGRVSELSRRLLNGESVPMMINHPVNWLELARGTGYARGSNTIESGRLCRDFVAFYGEDYLEYCGLLPKSGQNWVVGRVGGRQVAPAALEDVLMCVFFSERLGIREPDSWPVCPSQFASHGPGHPVDHRVRSNGALYCYCQCGMSFRLTRGDTGRFDKLVISVFGEPYAIRARQLAEQGLRPVLISRELGVSETTARRLVSGEQRYTSISLAERSNSIALEWRNVVDKCGSSARAQRSHSGLFRQVRRFASETAPSSGITKTEND